jgi:hypothetical protein
MVNDYGQLRSADEKAQPKAPIRIGTRSLDCAGTGYAGANFAHRMTRN